MNAHFDSSSQTPVLPLLSEAPTKHRKHPMVSRHNRAKIIATLGPACNTEEAIESLIRAGVSIFRLNMSHGSQEGHLANLTLIRQVAESMDYHIGILADLQGPKLRTAPMKNGEPENVPTGSTIRFIFSKEQKSTAEEIVTTSEELVASLEQGSQIFINDGLLRLQVSERVSTTECLCLVTQGGMLSDRKGINVPNTALALDALTEKDKKDALFAVKHGVDFLALSFVQRAEDVETLKQYLLDNGLTPPPIISKIEKPQALDDLDRIIDTSFGLMVARGDLGVELPAERVPLVQKDLIEKGKEYGKPVIVATQMLDSMINNINPTRAEVSDVANAVLEGADVVMLSGETATGAHPVAAVDMMNRIIVEVESHEAEFQGRPHEPSSVTSPHFHSAIAHAASYASIKADVKAIVALSSSGSMAQRIAKLRPNRPILALTESDDICRRMSLLWGVTPLRIEYGETTDEIINHGEEIILDKKLLQIGDSVLFCAGNTPILGATNMLKFLKIGEAVRSSAGLIQAF